MSMAVRLPEFDTLVSMHRDDPEAFEAFRRHVLNDAVESAPAAHRPGLRQLLARIEIAREAAATPMDALLVATRMMQDSVNQLENAWQQARYAVSGLQTALLIHKVRR